jgi:sulfur carrier protein ThiS adenylyltransferase
MKITVNERAAEAADGSTVGDIRQKTQPGADLAILNGFPVDDSWKVSEGDSLVFITRGVVPDEDELEALMAARHTPGVHEKVKKGRVAIAGLGGLGSSVAIALARSGVGSLRLIDFDVVEPSNLNRQQYLLNQIGLPKVEALRTNLSAINPFIATDIHYVRVTKDNAVQLLSGVDIVVEAFDDAKAKAMIIEAVLKDLTGVPIVAASGLAGYGPANDIVTGRVADNLYVVGDGISEARPGEGLMAPRVGVAAHHQANAVLRILLGEDPVGAGEGATPSPPGSNS